MIIGRMTELVYFCAAAKRGENGVQNDKNFDWIHERAFHTDFAAFFTAKRHEYKKKRCKHRESIRIYMSHTSYCEQAQSIGIAVNFDYYNFCYTLHFVFSFILFI